MMVQKVKNWKKKKKKKKKKKTQKDWTHFGRRFGDPHLLQ